MKIIKYKWTTISNLCDNKVGDRNDFFKRKLLSKRSPFNLEKMKREITISYKPGNISETPMIRISNNYLKKYGFNVGDKIEIEYKLNELIIKKIKVHKLNKK